MNKLTWRLSKLPTPSEVTELVKDKIITQEEAREILFSTKTEEDVDKDSLKSEIKFLRELVEKLSDRQTITKYVETIVPRYQNWQWSQPYYTYCNSLSAVPLLTYTSASYTGNTSLGAINTLSSSQDFQTTANSFTDISTF